MKRRTIAFVLCGTMMFSAMPAWASDFEAETIYTAAEYDAAGFENVSDASEITEEEISESKLSNSLNVETEEPLQEQEDTGAAEEQMDPDHLAGSDAQTTEDGQAVTEAEEVGGSDDQTVSDGLTDVDMLASTEKPVDFSTEEAAVDSVGSGYELQPDEVFVSDWKYRIQGDVVEFRLAEPAQKTEDEESLLAMASDEEVMPEASAEDLLQEDGTLVPQESEEADDTYGFLPLTQCAEEERYIGPETYYTKEDGLVHIKTVDAEGNLLTEGSYLFDENGILLTGQQELSVGLAGYAGETDGLAYFTDKDHAVMLAGAEEEEANPANSDLGQQVKDAWVWTGSVFQYYDAKGDFISVPDLKENAKKNADTYTGYFEIDNEKYILKNDGTPRTGDYKLEEGIRPGIYYLYPAENADDIPGKMAVSTWVYLKNSGKDRWRYYDKGGRTDITSKKVTVLDKNLNSSVGDKKYLLNESGYVYTKQTMAKLPDGNYYACNSSGVVYENQLVKINGARYYFGKGGKRASWSKGWHRCKGADNRFYYFDNNNGKVIEQKGWIRISLGSGKYGWFYFPKNGNHYINKWTGNKTYYFKKNGVLGSGMETIGDKTYYFKPSTETDHRGQVYKSTLFRSRGEKYYATSTGELAKSKWIKLNGNYYYFRYNGMMMKEEFVTGPDGKTHGYLDKDGKFTTGWVVVNDSKNQVKYLNPEGRGFLENTAYTINDVRYYFDSDGFRVPDLTKFSLKNKEDDLLSAIHSGKFRGKYILEVDKSNGVVCVYVNSSKYGKVPVRSLRTSVGANIDNTPNGTYTIHRWAEWTLLNGPSWGQWGSRVVDGIFMHSIACPEPNRYNLNTSAYDMLGSPASQGCIRLCVADAKWVYDNCNGCQITIFTGTYRSSEVFKSPLGRKPLVRRYGAGNFDPTDPAIVGNKYY